MSTRRVPPRLLARALSITTAAFAVTSLFMGSACAGDWTNSGGNAGRYGLSDEIGPTGPELAWSGGRARTARST